MTKKLLVADDSQTIQTIVGLAFAQEDFEIAVVASGDLVPEKARSMKPDIILADVFMPGYNGYEVCEIIKTDPDLCHIPVVLMVGTFEAFDQDEAKRVGYDGCLTKPFDTNELVQTVRSLAGSDSVVKVDAGHDRQNTEVEQLGPLVSDRTRESFLASSPVLDLFASLNVSGSPEGSAALLPKVVLPQEILRSVVEGVVRQLSPDIVREVAWEVIPELSEMLIRQRLTAAGSQNSLSSKDNQ